jgi:hypothetical protein
LSNVQNSLTSGCPAFYQGTDQNSLRNSKPGKTILRYVTVLLCLVEFIAGPTYGQIASDITVSQDGASASTIISSPAFTTSAANEQLLAFIAADYLSGSNTTVKSVSGGGLTWSLVKRTNAQNGTSEIWGALAATPLTGVSISATLSQKVVSSITVMSFTGVSVTKAIGATAGNSANPGSPTASLVTTGSNSWVLGVGSDWDNAIARTLGAGQTLIHQDLSLTGDTYWVQRMSSPIPASGITATINDTAPTKDRYNLSIIELLAGLSTGATYSISGTISPAATGSGATVTLSGTSVATTVADANGNYAFTGLSNGSYTVTPNRTGYTFTPANQSVTISGANQAGVNFTAQATTWSISGVINPTSGGAGATVTLSGAASATTVSDGNGNYSFTGLTNGSYTVTPTNTGYTFTPASQSVTINGTNQAGINFTAQSASGYSISGVITPAASGSGTTITLSGTSKATTTSDANGNYSFTGLANGVYTVTPGKSGFTFTPQTKSITVNNGNLININFAAAVSTASLARDVTVSQDNAVASTTIVSPVFSTAAGGELLLAFVATDYLSGANTTVKSVAGGGLTWTLVKRANAQDGTAEIWAAAAGAPLAGVTVTATLSQSVASSLTVMTLTGTNSTGGVGATGSNGAASGAPTASLVTTGNGSLVIGVGNDWDNAIARTVGSGQILVHQNLTSAGDTYWVQMQGGTIAAAPLPPVEPR